MFRAHAFGSCCALAILTLLQLGLIGEATAQTPLERGKYLMDTVVACGNCHTPQTPEGQAPGREFAGGTPFVEPFGTADAANITPTGVGKWSDADIKTAITTGVRPDGVRLKPPMGYH